MREEILGPRYAIRLGDLRPWHVLRVKCLQCRRAATLSPAPLLVRFGEHQRIAGMYRMRQSPEGRGGNSVTVRRLDQNA